GAGLTLRCRADTTTDAIGVATATDTCGSVSIGYSDVTTNGCGNTYGIVRTWTATDSCGNSASCNQHIVVIDTTAPSITCPADLTLQCPAVTTTNAIGVATATDTRNSVSVGYSDVTTNGCGNTYGIVRTWTATDSCDQKSTR